MAKRRKTRGKGMGADLRFQDYTRYGKRMEAIIEAMVDSHSVHAVLSTLQTVCYEKSAHVTENWGDDALAQIWAKASRICELAANKAGEIGV